MGRWGKKEQGARAGRLTANGLSIAAGTHLPPVRVVALGLPLRSGYCGASPHQGPAPAPTPWTHPAHSPRRALFDEYDSLCDVQQQQHQHQLGADAADHTPMAHAAAACSAAADSPTPDGPLPARKLALAGRVVRLLSTHASAEERSLYPLARAVLPYGRELYDKSLVDDQVGGWGPRMEAGGSKGLAAGWSYDGRHGFGGSRGVAYGKGDTPWQLVSSRKWYRTGYWSTANVGYSSNSHNYASCPTTSRITGTLPLCPVRRLPRSCCSTC